MTKQKLLTDEFPFIMYEKYISLLASLWQTEKRNFSILASQQFRCSCEIYVFFLRNAKKTKKNIIDKWETE